MKTRRVRKPNTLQSTFQNRQWRHLWWILIALAAVFLGGLALWFCGVLIDGIRFRLVVLILCICGLLTVALAVAFFCQNVWKPYLKLQSTMPQDRYQITRKENYDMVLGRLIDDYAAMLSSHDTAQLLKIRAELDAMQNQINPHFLYNTLDTIRSQAMEDGSTKTATMIETLSSLFRYTISQKNEMQTVYQELRNIENYIKIQQYRFHNKYVLDVQIPFSDSVIMNYKIPKLTLQPIVENCIFHGLREKEDNCVITVRAYTTQASLVIVISDNGVGMDDSRLRVMNARFANNEYASSRNLPQTSSGQGIALINVNARIRMIFGDRYGITAYSARGIGTDIHITLPLTINEGKIYEI